MPKESFSLNTADYRPVLIIPLLPNVFEKIVAGKLSLFLESNGLLPIFQFSYKKGLGTYDALLTLSHHLQLVWAGTWRKGLFTWTSQLHLIRLVSTVVV